MKQRSGLIALCAGVLWLGACDKNSAPLPMPTADTPVTTVSGATAGSARHPSVPSADSVLSPASATTTDPTLGRTNTAMTAGQQSMAMPMPGQNNDHSAPLGPSRRASAP